MTKQQQQQQQQQPEEPHMVKLYSLQRGLWTIPRDDIFLRYNFSGNPDHALSSVTICYRIRLERLALYDIHLSYAISDEASNSILVFSDGAALKVYLDDQVQALTSGTRFEVSPEAWQHLCHVLDRTYYAIYWQGQEFTRGAPEGWRGLLLNGTLVLGQEQDALSGGFTATQILHGDIAQVSFWDYLLPAEDIADLAACRALGRGNLFSLDTASVEVIGPVQESLVSLSDLCRTTPYYVVLPEGRSFSESLGKCRLFGGFLAVPTSNYDNELLFDHLKSYMEVCGNSRWKLWLGLTDEATEGVWVDVNTQRATSYLALKPGEPDGGVFDNCMSMKLDGYWGNELCRMKKCAGCHFLNSSLRLRGLCFENEYQTRFRLDGYINRKPFFHGYYDQVIMWDIEREVWRLVHSATNTTLAESRLINTHDYPLGLEQWILNSSMCNILSGESINLSLSNCASGQFMCLSGSCISPQKRCNLRHDCIDGSDEDDCGSVLVTPEYRSFLPPPLPGGRLLPLSPALTLARFTSIDDVSMTISIEFYLTLVWRDDRLTLKHLQEGKETVLYEEDSAKVWKPEFRITNLDSGRIKLLRSSMSVTTHNNASDPHYNYVDTDLVYPGAANDLALTHHYVASVSCFFDLYVYPFDTQTCSIDVQLLSSYEKYVRFELESSSFKYSGPDDLTRYSVHNLKLNAASTSGQVSFTFELSRRKGITVMTTFVPSVLLLLVSWATLFVRLDALNVRAVMSLTTLLVLYTLFSNLSSSLPITASIKLIDIWFFSIIFLLFINIIAHIFVNIENNTLTPFAAAAPPKAVKVGWAAVGDMPLSVKLFVWYRKCVLPLAIVLFSVVFCTVLFTYPSA